MVTMDWAPTLLAAAGTSPDAAYPSDGEDLGPIVTGRAAPHSRKLYWRYMAGSQRAIWNLDVQGALHWKQRFRGVSGAARPQHSNQAEPCDGPRG